MGESHDYTSMPSTVDEVADRRGLQRASCHRYCLVSVPLMQHLTTQLSASHSH